MFHVSYGQEDSVTLNEQEKALLLHIRRELLQRDNRDTLHVGDYSDPMAQNFAKIRDNVQELYRHLHVAYHAWDESDTIILDGTPRAYTEIINSPHKSLVENYFILTATLRDSVLVDADHVLLEIDTTFTPTIASNPELRLGGFSTYTYYYDTTVRYTIKVESDSLVDVDPRGKLKVRLHYLMGYDTIVLSPSVDRRRIEVNGAPFTVERIQDGDIVINYTDELNFTEIWDRVKYITSNATGQAIFPKKNSVSREEDVELVVEEKEGLQNFSQTIFGPERVFSPEALALTDQEYLEVVTQTGRANRGSGNLVAIQRIGYDFDKLILFIPQYRYHESKVLIGQVSE